MSDMCLGVRTAAGSPAVAGGAVSRCGTRSLLLEMPAAVRLSPENVQFCLR